MVIRIPVPQRKLLKVFLHEYCKWIGHTQQVYCTLTADRDIYSLLTLIWRVCYWFVMVNDTALVDLRIISVIFLPQIQGFQMLKSLSNIIILSRQIYVVWWNFALVGIELFLCVLLNYALSKTIYNTTEQPIKGEIQ